MIYTFTAAAAYATAAAAYADMVKIRLSTALALFSWGLAELGNKLTHIPKWRVGWGMVWFDS